MEISPILIATQPSTPPSIPLNPFTTKLKTARQELKITKQLEEAKLSTTARTVKVRSFPEGKDRHRRTQSLLKPVLIRMSLFEALKSPLDQRMNPPIKLVKFLARPKHYPLSLTLRPVKFPFIRTRLSFLKSNFIILDYPTAYLSQAIELSPSPITTNQLDLALQELITSSIDYSPFEITKPTTSTRPSTLPRKLNKFKKAFNIVSPQKIIKLKRFWIKNSNLMQHNQAVMEIWNDQEEEVSTKVVVFPNSIEVSVS